MTSVRQNWRVLACITHLLHEMHPCIFACFEIFAQLECVMSLAELEWAACPRRCSGCRPCRTQSCCSNQTFRSAVTPLVSHTHASLAARVCVCVLFPVAPFSNEYVMSHTLTQNALDPPLICLSTECVSLRLLRICLAGFWSEQQLPICSLVTCIWIQWTCTFCCAEPKAARRTCDTDESEKSS